MHRRAYLAALPTAVGSLAGCVVRTPFGGASGRVTHSGSTAFDAAEALAVDTTDGDVLVTGEDRADVLVEFEIRGPSEAAVEATSVAGRRADGELTVHLRRGDARGVGRTGARLAVRCPAGTALTRANTDNGAIEVQHVAGDPTLETTNGRVEARGIGGTVTADTTNGAVDLQDVGGFGGASTTNGGVDVDVPAVGDDVTAEATNGDVSAALAPDLDVRVEASTTNGDVSVSGLDFAAVSADGDDFSGTLGDGTHDLTLETTNGDVDLTALET